MFDRELFESARRQYEEGTPPSGILRELGRVAPDASVPDLMRFMQEAFALPYSAVQCIGGWWYEGSSELSDAQLDAFLVPEIEKAGRAFHGPEEAPPLE